MTPSFPSLDEHERLSLLVEPPVGRRLAVVLDTDPFNEIDDQFAITYAALSPDRIELKAIHAAPFLNSRSEHDPAKGMRKSVEVTREILAHIRFSVPVLEGAPRFMTRDAAGFTGDPVESPATQSLVELARDRDRGDPLHVVCIAALTNVASAILLAPELVSRIVVVWLGGHPTRHPDADEFNLRQDVFAARVVLDCGVPLVLVPCAGVAESLLLTWEDVRARVAGRGAIGDYLAREYSSYASRKGALSRSIWDMGPIAWLLDPALVQSALVPTPILATSPLRSSGYHAPHLGRPIAPKANRLAHCTWSLDPRRHLMREVLGISRDPIFADFFAKLDRQAGA